jgi:hypothetical protein
MATRPSIITIDSQLEGKVLPQLYFWHDRTEATHFA